MTDEKRIAELIINRLRQALSQQEKEELDAWIAASPRHAQFLETRVTPEAVARNLRHLAGVNEESLDEKIRDKIRKSTRARAPRPQAKRVLWITVVSAVAAAMVAYLFVRPPALPAKSDYTPYHASIWNSQSPVLNKKVKRPTLTMSDSSFYLDSMPIGKLAWLGNWLILKRENHYIAYMKMRSLRNGIPDSAYNMIAIPPDDTTWKVTLPDGSIFGLAPGSSLAFVVHPEGLTTTPWLAALDGQAEISVPHNERIPFYLETSQTEITIHGTHLRVRDYQDEDSSSTLLYNGSLSISNGWSHSQLEPGELATTRAADRPIGIARPASLPEEELLKDEEFDFSHVPLDTALRKLAQWYGIAHIYVDRDLHADSLRRLSLGHINKDLSLPQLLTQLQMTTKTMHFTANIDAISVFKQTASGPDQSHY